jgi:hypothetical protein
LLGLELLFGSLRLANLELAVNTPNAGSMKNLFKDFKASTLESLTCD